MAPEGNLVVVIAHLRVPGKVGFSAQFISQIRFSEEGENPKILWMEEIRITS
jgi:hypothetical protein